MSSEYKRLYRSRQDRMIGGVCAGLGEYIGLDPTVVRLLFAAMLFFGGPGAVLAYLVLLLVVPEEPVPSEAS